ncbi:MAG TPA: prolyl oligopeptidase family serine peptidase, partial [Gemmataceae bacterium]|nr:prolyl oligopeptidase family serine peptidase [Gemmataceae bacterium]
EHFRAMHAYSPYHRVKDGTPYPAVLLLAGINDNRVSPSESWKMAARLQAATASGRPVLLWTSLKSGHDTVGSEQLSQLVDVFAFLFHELGVKYRADP